MTTKAGDISKPDVDIEDTSISGGPSGQVSIRIVRPKRASGTLPVILYIHGAGWVFGNTHTHDRLIRELAAGTGAAVVFPNYSLSPEARFPVAIEESYVVAAWLATRGPAKSLDGSRVAVAGDSVGGNMTAALTLLAKERSGPTFVAQVLFYPVTNASFEPPVRRAFLPAPGGMQWFWDQYTKSPADRAQVIASPLRATLEQLAGLPPALVITGEADVLRDEGEAYASKLREAGVPVVAVCYQGIIHDFVMLNALRGTQAAQAAISQAVSFLKDRLRATP